MQQYGEDYDRVDDYELPGTMRKTHRIEDCTILDTETDSDGVDLRGYGLIGLIIPTITNSALTFEVSETEGGTYRQVQTNALAAFTIAAGTGDIAISADSMAPLCAYRWVKIISAEAQGADRVFHFLVKG